MDLKRLQIDRPNEAARAAAPAPRRSNVPVFKLAFLAALIAGTWALRHPLMSAIDSVRLPVVETAEVVRRAPAAALALSGATANGYIIARVRAALSADTPGRIVELNVVEGQRVEKDFVVARLYSREFEAALAAAESEVVVATEALAREQAALATSRADVNRLAAARDAAKAMIAESEADVVLWTLEVERARELVESGVEMQRVLDQATATLAIAMARVESAKARTASSEAELGQSDARLEEQRLAVREAAAQLETKKALRDEAAARLDKTFIRAPFDGIVVLKDAEVGEVVSPNVQAGGNARGSVVTMVDFASLEMQGKVPEASLGMVKLGAPATVILDAYPSFAYAAVVDRIWPTADKKEGTIEVRARFLAPDDKLRPEMQARIVFGADSTAPPEAGEAPDLLLAPHRAVVRQGGNDFAFVVERDEVAERRIELGERVGDSVAILSGLDEGDIVVLDPPASLAQGSRVRIKK